MLSVLSRVILTTPITCVLSHVTMTNTGMFDHTHWMLTILSHVTLTTPTAYFCPDILWLPLDVDCLDSVRWYPDPLPSLLLLELCLEN